MNFSGRVDPTVAASVHQYHPTMRMASEFVQKRDAHVLSCLCMCVCLVSIFGINVYIHVLSQSRVYDHFGSFSMMLEKPPPIPKETGDKNKH